MTPAWCLLAESASHTFYRLARLQSMSEWWHGLLLVAVCAAIVAYVVVMYWRDSAELSRGVGWSLAVLRLLAFARHPVLLSGPRKTHGRSRDQAVAGRAAGRHQPEHGLARCGRHGRFHARPVASTRWSANCATANCSGNCVRSTTWRSTSSAISRSRPRSRSFADVPASRTSDRDQAQQLVAEKQSALHTARATALVAAGLAGRVGAGAARCTSCSGAGPRCANRCPWRCW